MTTSESKGRFFLQNESIRITNRIANWNALPSVTSRSSTKTNKRRITQTTPYDSPDTSFLKPKISAKFDRGHPLRGRQMQVGWVKIGDFRQITGYISKTVQDRRMVSIKVEYEVVCALSNGDIADDLERPLSAQTTPICTFCSF